MTVGFGTPDLSQKPAPRRQHTSGTYQNVLAHPILRANGLFPPIKMENVHRLLHRRACS